MGKSVTLHKQTSKGHAYWVIRWMASDGRRPGKNLGRVDTISKRQAEKMRRQKEIELETHPGRRDVRRSPELAEFLERYYADRKTELRPGTMELHQQTGRYLIGYFGERRRLDTIARVEARAFKTALARGELAHVNKRRKTGLMAATTVDQQIRQARKFFNHALSDDLITFNPFDRLGQNDPVEKDWHDVDRGEFGKLMNAAKLGWQLLFALCRWAGLRLEEALELPGSKIDLESRRLTVISREDFTVKDKDARTIPIVPELHEFLKERGVPESGLAIPRELVSRRNVWRDFRVLCKRAEVTPYAKPFHALRKSCITDWAARFPAHVVKEWAGHADIRTTLKYYLKVSDGDYRKAAGLPITDDDVRAGEDDFEQATRSAISPMLKELNKAGDGTERKEPAVKETVGSPHSQGQGHEVVPVPSSKLTQLLTQPGDFETSSRRKSIAGEGIRTLDVQLGKLAFYH